MIAAWLPWTLVAFTALLAISRLAQGLAAENYADAFLDADPAGFEHHKMQELVETAGYPLEEHFVQTADGYVLGLYRIPHGRTSPPDGTHPGPLRPPVLLQHGLLDSSATWVVNKPDQSLGFILADAGYDVWLSNSRGNAFSRNHTGFSPATAAFWDFSFDDMADYDLPAVVDYVLRQNQGRADDTAGTAQLAYIGHSQGTAIAFAALTSNPALRAKLSIMVALAPVAYLRYTSSIPMILLAQLHTDQLFDLLGQHEFLPARKATADIFEEVCRASPLTCVSVLTAICGFNEQNLNLTRLPTYVAYAPSGTSVKNMAHWAQAARQSAQRSEPLFRRYDYGTACLSPTGAPQNCNQRVYGSMEPPSFDLSAIAGVPLALFSGIQDKLADPVDVQSLQEALPEGAVVFRHSERSYEHIDFTWGMSSAERIYPAVLRLLRQYHGPWDAVQTGRVPPGSTA